ncbi:MAG: hypothetical protein ACOCXJ_02610 [Planctomycetota bacterium]
MSARFLLALLLSSCAGLLAAQEPLPWTGAGLRVDRAHPLVRGGLLYRLHCRPSGSTRALIPPLQLDLRLLHAGDELATRRLVLPDVATWEQGLDVHLQPPRRLPLAPLRLIVVLTDATGAAARLEAPVWSVASCQQRLITAGAAYDRLPRSLQDPLLGLWLEQAVLLVRDSRRLHDCQRLLDLINAIEDAPHSLTRARAVPDTRLEAFHARSDGSLQPVRYHLPSDRPRGLLVWLQGLRETPSKVAWPQPPDDLTALATAAGWALVEVYPAGDPHWQDLAPRRIEQALTAVLQAQTDWSTLPRAIGGGGSAAVAALHQAATDPWAWPTVLLQAPAAPPERDVGSALAPNSRSWLQMACARPTTVLSGPPPARLALIGAPGELVPAWNAVRHPADDPDLWRWLAEPTTPARVDLAWALPSRSGPLALVELEHWGRPARLRLDATGETLRLVTTGVGSVAWLDPDRQLDLIDGNTVQERIPTRRSGKGLGRPTGLAGGYADDTWTLVLGAGEHAAATVQNRHNAEALLQAWAGVSQGAARIVTDEAAASQLRGHLVCLGSPSGNAVLRRLLDEEDLPLRWDERQLHMPTNGASWQRAEMGVVLVRPHPRDPDRMIVIADGPRLPELFGPGLPFAALPDCSILGPDGLRQWLQDDRWRLIPASTAGGPASP